MGPTVYFEFAYDFDSKRPMDAIRLINGLINATYGYLTDIRYDIQIEGEEPMRKTIEVATDFTNSDIDIINQTIPFVYHLIP